MTITWIVWARSAEISWVGVPQVQGILWRVRRPLTFNTSTQTQQSQWLRKSLDCSPVAGGYQGGVQAPGYVTRKELVKSGLLLGAGILKGALLTTVINNINNNNGK